MQMKNLENEGFTKGLAKALGENCEIFPIRFWVIDNSSSMCTRDGHRTVIINEKAKDIKCSRWEEIKDCVSYHSKFSDLLNAPTEFKLLNSQNDVPQSFRVGSKESPYDHKKVRELLDKTNPNGLTPLTKHILSLQKEIMIMAPELRKMGQKAVIVLATDGIPMDGYSSRKKNRDDFVTAMRSLEGLPVWIVIRLCTDEDDVVSFYNDLDDNLELSLEVLDDFDSEAKEVYEFNKWLNYTLAIHKTRELGFQDRVFDLIDERSLTRNELRRFLAILFGEENFDAVPDPNIDWYGFVAEIGRLLGNEQPKWNPIKKAVLPLIDIRELNKAYSPSHGCQCILS